MDELNDAETVRIARGASEVLGNEAYVRAMASLKAQIVEQWKEAPIRDREGQLVLLQLAKIAEKFDGILSGYIQAGKLAQHKIDLESVRNEGPVKRAVRRTFSKN